MRLINGGWPFTHPPNMPFTINQESPQARGLTNWVPFLDQAWRERFTGETLTAGGTPERQIKLDRPATYLSRGSSEYLYATPLAVPKSEPVSLSAWYYVDPSGSNFRTHELLTICDYDVAGTRGEGFHLIVKIRGNKTTWQVEAETSNSAFNSLANSGDLTVPLGWHHVCATFPATNERNIYLDGVFRATNAAGNDPTDTLDTLAIGTWFVNSAPITDYAHGWLFDARVYDRALSANEVYSLYDPATRWQLYKPIVPNFVVAVTEEVITHVPRHPSPTYQIPAIY